MKRAQAKRLRKLIKDYAQAEVNKSHMGANHPATWPDYEKELKRSRELLTRYISNLTSEP